MAIELVCPNLGEASMEEWRRWWNLKVPLKIRHFWWRARQNRLATRTRLQQKRVDAIYACIFCEAVGELKERVFVYFSFAKCCWRELGTGVHLTLDCELQDWFFNLFYLVDECLISKAAATLCVLMPAHRGVKKATEFLNI